MNADTAWTLVDVALMILTPVIAWVGLRASKWIGALEANEKSGGMLARLTGSIVTAVKTVNQTTKRQLKAAKDPASDGGTRVTEAEAAALKQAAWDEITAYWGAKGLATAGKVIGLGDVTRFVNGKIEGFVDSEKKAAKTLGPQ